MKEFVRIMKEKMLTSIDDIITTSQCILASIIFVCAIFVPGIVIAFVIGADVWKGALISGIAIIGFSFVYTIICDIIDRYKKSNRPKE